MITKEKLQEYIDQFPNEFSIDELIDKLVFVEKLESRLKESDENKVIDESQIKSEVEKWFE